VCQNLKENSGAKGLTYSVTKSNVLQLIKQAKAVKQALFYVVNQDVFIAYL
jgi:hypothetical protein